MEALLNEITLDRYTAYDNALDYRYGVLETMFEEAVQEHVYSLGDFYMEEKEECTEKECNAFVKVIKAVVKAIKNLMEEMRNFFDKALMSKKDKERFEAFQKAMKQYPELKNAKITVKDWRQLDKEYDDAEALLEKLYKSDISQKEMDAKMDVAVSAIGKTVKATTTTVTMDAMMRMAMARKKDAQRLYNKLAKDEKAMNELIDLYGKDGAVKYMKELESHAKKVSFTRWKQKLLKKKFSGNITDNFLYSMDAFAKNVSDSTGIPIKSFAFDVIAKGDSVPGKIAENIKRKNNEGTIGNLIDTNNALSTTKEIATDLHDTVEEIPMSAWGEYKKNKIKGKVSDIASAPRRGVKRAGRAIGRGAKDVGRGFKDLVRGR